MIPPRRCAEEDPAWVIGNGPAEVRGHSPTDSRAKKSFLITRVVAVVKNGVRVIISTVLSRTFAQLSMLNMQYHGRSWQKPTER